ncbi:LPXTG cell wall anchor domain-containing protein [Microbacterium sp.]|uniref:LPXTG cell wall anchor domain-containing protein n=1 Tax=Microbacterium sp. TaxID=51671 RepID=UPI00289B5C3F|nr:LPXTG cell wall anchor domain-containing protein [Microbacterium sp.]
MIRRILRPSRAALAAVLIGAGLFAAPAAAQASTIYPPSDACQVSPSTAAPGASFAFSCAADTFSANESVKITITGENGSGATFGFVRFAVSTGAYDTTSGPEGQLPDTTITLPSDASGIYNIAAVSATSAGGTASVTVSAADGSALPSTGGDGLNVALWAGGGVLLLAGGAVAIIAARRRSR